MNQPDAQLLLKSAELPRKRRLSHPNEPVSATRRSTCRLAMIDIMGSRHSGGTPSRTLKLEAEGLSKVNISGQIQISNRRYLHPMIDALIIMVCMGSYK